MADAKPAPDKHAKPADGAAAAPAEAGTKAKSPLIPVVLAIVVLLGIGGGGGFMLAGMIPQAPTAKSDKAHGGETAKAGEHGGEAHLDHSQLRELAIGDLITNIANQDGRRYIKVTCAVWIAASDAEHIEGHGGEGEVQVKKLMQMTLEEQLKRYELSDLTGRGIIGALTQDFTVVLEDLLHQQFPEQPKDHHFIQKVILNNLLVQ
jgi:flagellar basal body-associated protein FliL